MTDRIDELLGRMSIEEKVSMLAGSDIWHSTGVPRLGIPPIKMTYGPCGARGGRTCPLGGRGRSWGRSRT